MPRLSVRMTQDAHDFVRLIADDEELTFGAALNLVVNRQKRSYEKYMREFADRLNNNEETF